MQRSLYIRVSTAINILILLVLVAIAKLYVNSANFGHAHILFSVISVIMLANQLIQLKRRNISITSFFSVFLILSYVFNFGYIYLKLFGQTDFLILYRDWFNSDLQAKYNGYWFALCAIQATFSGIIININKKQNNNIQEYRTFRKLPPETKKQILFWVGIVLLLISLPCRLIWDINQVKLSTISAEYVGGYSATGIIDDLQILFTPALICLMCGKKVRSQKFARIVILLYIVYAMLIMGASGARRAHVTNLLVMVIFYMAHYSPKRKYGLKGFFLCAGIIVVLNILTLIRENRHSSLGIMQMISENFEVLFSLDVIWEVFAEFGITGTVTYFTQRYFPLNISYQYGLSYLASFIYILPIGWLVKLNSSPAAMFNAYGQSIGEIRSGLGGSYIGDLYANWGWWSLLFAIPLGYLIGEFGYIDDRNKTSIRTVVNYCMSFVFLNYVRASIGELMRAGAYIVLAIYIISYFLKEKWREEKARVTS